MHYCQGCSGIWHDQGILDEFSRLSGLPELLQGKPVFSHPSDRRCPRCEVPMERIGLGEVKFLIERCRSCRGLWLDHGEMPKAGAGERTKLSGIVARGRATNRRWVVVATFFLLWVVGELVSQEAFDKWKAGELIAGGLVYPYPPEVKKAREPYYFWLTFALYTLVFAAFLAGSIINTFLWLLDCLVP